MAANYQRIQIRRGTVTSFASFNPVLASGEPAMAIENGTGILKVGDGHTAWNNIAGLRTDVDETITSGVAVFASGEAVRVSGAITTEINNLVDSAPGALNTLNEIAAAINDDANFIGTFLASGHAYTNALGGVSGILNTVSGLSIFNSGQIVGNHINIDNLSGVVPNTDVSKFPRFIFKPSGQTLNTQSTVQANDLKIGSTPLGGFRTGSIGQHLNIISGIAVYASGNGGGGDVSQADFDIASGIGVFSSGQSVALQTSVGLVNTSSGVLNTSVGLLNVASGALNTSLGLLETASGNLNDTSHIVSGIAIFASGKALAGGGSGPSQGEFNIVSGIAIYASGNTGSGLVTTAAFDIVSGVSVFSSGQDLLLNTTSGLLNTSVGLLQTNSGLLNTSVGLVETSSGSLNTSVGLLETSSGSLNTSVGLIETSSGSLNTSVGLLETSSGSLNTIVGAVEVFSNIISGIAVFASGNGGGGDVSTGQFNIASGISAYSSGQSLILNTASGALNTSIGLLGIASGALNTLTGFTLNSFTTLSGIATTSQSGNFGYHTHRSGGANSSASGNISGVSNMVMVDNSAYNSLDKQTNTLYFIPSG